MLEFARLLSPVDDPACRMYEVGAHPPAGLVHVKVTVVPLDEASNPLGAFGALTHALVPTMRIDSFEGPLRPPAFCARTRT